MRFWCGGPVEHAALDHGPIARGEDNLAPIARGDRRGDFAAENFACVFRGSVLHGLTSLGSSGRTYGPTSQRAHMLVQLLTTDTTGPKIVVEVRDAYVCVWVWVRVCVCVCVCVCAR